MAFYMQNFGKVLGILVTGGSSAANQNGLAIFEWSGKLISQDISKQIEQEMIKFSETQMYMKDLSKAYDYKNKTFLFKVDDLTNSAFKRYFTILKENFKLKPMMGNFNSQSEMS